MGVGNIKRTCVTLYIGSSIHGQREKERGKKLKIIDFIRQCPFLYPWDNANNGHKVLNICVCNVHAYIFANCFDRSIWDVSRGNPLCWWSVIQE